MSPAAGPLKQAPFSVGPLVHTHIGRLFQDHVCPPGARSLAKVSLCQGVGSMVPEVMQASKYAVSQAGR